MACSRRPYIAVRWVIWCGSASEQQGTVAAGCRCGTATPNRTVRPAIPVRSSAMTVVKKAICRLRQRVEQGWSMALSATGVVERGRRGIIKSLTSRTCTAGTPLGIADNDERYGAQGAFLIEAGISSSHHIASFFGLTERISRPRAAASEAPIQAAKPILQPASASPRTADIATVLQPLTDIAAYPGDGASAATPARSMSLPSLLVR